MTDFEKIKGSAVTALFNDLIRTKIPLKLTLVNTGYYGLSQVISLTERQKKNHLELTLPEGFEKAVADLDIWQCHVEFDGIDHVTYAFTASGSVITTDRIYLELPQELERQQRRELFRIEAPAGTRLCFSIDASRLELEVLNISIGGSLAALVQTNADRQQDFPLEVAQKLEEAALAFPVEIMRQPIQIDAVQIKRIVRDPETNRYEAGFKFSKISSNEQKRLTDLIYKLQRQYLRRRLPVDL